ncbi:S-adenosyl-L-methionine-dependent methyltransferase [Exidia glandulosa HHB12029]|uniref:S-adenosyl-L-methionine-dependent methyltransferase n=1 Tax=Exidia glandulosa HHB12029 TaxID=1314781 RepID=A0A165Q0U1_EXIGL|nr:S-adenosyl-L-methionine-dependent methyltransferase [Exidia glandulosa HHB12029]
MTVASLVTAPTTLLPPLKLARDVTRSDLLRFFAHLRALYCPSIHGFAHARTRHDGEDDAFERSHAVRWLTGFVALYSEYDDMDELVAEAASVLAVCAGSSAQGTITRSFSFPDSVEIMLQDAPLETDESGSNVGLQTWGSSYVLADCLVRSHPSLLATVLNDNDNDLGLRVLELGAGTGLVSLALARVLPANATIVATDYHPAVLENLRANVALNNLDERVHVRALDWRDYANANSNSADPTTSSCERDTASLPPAFDVIVAADVVYEAEQCSWLSACVRALLRRPQGDKPSGVFHLVVPVRPTHAIETELVEAAFPLRKPGAVYELPTLVSSSREELDAHTTMQTGAAVYRRYSVVWSS